ncbi:MAG: acyltransferase [bacterium]|nr:acyltransferase [bacterium]
MYKFTKQDTAILKGVAIILMLAHHLFFFPTRLPEKMIPISFTKIDHIDTAVYIGRFGKMCVPIFLFLSGYGIYKTYISGRLSIPDRIYNLYIKFWKVFIVFVPIGFMYFSNQPQYCKQEGFYNTFAKFELVGLVRSFTGLGLCYNREWWFLKYFVITILLFPLIYKVVSKRTFWENVWIIIAFVMAFKFVINNLHTFPAFEPLKNSYLYSNFVGKQEPYISSFWMGCVMAKDDQFEKLILKYQQLRLNTILKDCIALTVLLIVRNSIIGIEIDCVYTPILCVVSLDLLKKSKLISMVFIQLGKQSTNMWLIHSFFIYYFYECVKIVLLPKYAILVLPWLVLISFVSGVLLDFGYKVLAYVYHLIVRIFPFDSRHTGSMVEAIEAGNV